MVWLTIKKRERKREEIRHKAEWQADPELGRVMIGIHRINREELQNLRTNIDAVGIHRRERRGRVGNGRGTGRSSADPASPT